MKAFFDKFVTRSRQCFGKILCESEIEVRWVAGMRGTGQEPAAMNGDKPLTWKMTVGVERKRDMVMGELEDLIRPK